MTSLADATAMPDAASRHGEEARRLVTALQRQRGPDLYAFGRRLGLTAEGADDATQETLLRLWAALGGGTEIINPDAWAFRTLYRIAMDQHRLAQRVRGLLGRLRPRVTVAEAGTTVDRLALWDAVDRLPPRQRAAVYLRYRADLPYESIAEVLGISPVSARSHVSRGLDRLGLILSREDFR